MQRRSSNQPDSHHPETPGGLSRAGESVYHLYKSGILLARIKRVDGDILYQNYDLWTGRWAPEYGRELRVHGFFVMDIRSLFASEAEFLRRAIPQAMEVRLQDGRRYQREPNRQEPVAWAQRDVKWPVDRLVMDQQVIAYIQLAREHVTVLVLEGYPSHTPVDSWPRAGEASLYPVERLGAFEIAMADGVSLATEVYLPVGRPGCRLPAILLRTPYGRERMAMEELRYVQRGYALVAQDVRGKGDSGGEWSPFIHERKDGSQTLDWIAKQPWSDGKVGMTGASYGGYVQWACADHPHLKAMVSVVTAGTPFVDVPRKGGAFLSGMLAWLAATAGKGVNPSRMKREDWAEVLNFRPLRSLPQRAFEETPPYWEDWMDHPDNDTFWRQADWSLALQGREIQAASLIMTGWYDDNFAGSMQAWEAIRGQGNEKRLLIGPWGHDLNTSRDIHGVSASNAGLLYDIDLQSFAWFERHLKGIQEVMDDRDSKVVRYYITGGQGWRRDVGWPPAASSPLCLFLGYGGRLNEKPGPAGFDEYIYDPQVPSPHCLDLSENEMGVPGNYAQAERRGDMLTYTTGPLTRDMTFAGPIRVCLYASSTARDTDWVVRVLDTDGLEESIKVSEGVLRAKYRDSFSAPKPLTPGQEYRYDLELSPIAHCFRQGRAIRMSITSSAFGFIFPNHNTGKNPAMDTEYVKARQRIHFGGLQASTVTLDLLPQDPDPGADPSPF